jgi:hypothetical protein
MTRRALARVTGELEHTLYKWHAARARNGHPEGVTLDGQLYFDEQEWRDWRAAHGADRRVIDGRVMVTPAELARISGEPEATLTRWYVGRAANGHPEGLRLDKRRYVDEQEWMAWYRGHKKTLKAGLTPVDRSGDPDELLNTTQAAKLLGYTNPSTITNYVRRDQFIQPDRVETTPSGAERRFWARRTLWTFADQRTWSRAPRRRMQPENAGHDG